MASTPSDADFDSGVATGDATSFTTSTRTFLINRHYFLIASARKGGGEVPTAVVQTSDSTAWASQVDNVDSNTGIAIWYLTPASTFTDDTLTITYSGTQLRFAFHIVEYTTLGATPIGLNGEANDSTSPTDGISFTWNVDDLSGGLGGSAMNVDSLSYTPDSGWVNDAPNDLATGEALSQGAAYIVSATETTDDYDMAYSGSPSEGANVVLEIRGVAVGGANPKGPFGMPFHGPFAGPIGYHDFNIGNEDIIRNARREMKAA